MGRSNGGEWGALWGRIWAVLPLERRAMWIITCHVEAGWKNANLFWRERSSEGVRQGRLAKQARAQPRFCRLHAQLLPTQGGGGWRGWPPSIVSAVGGKGCASTSPIEKLVEVEVIEATKVEENRDGTSTSLTENQRVGVADKVEDVDEFFKMKHS